LCVYVCVCVFVCVCVYMCVCLCVHLVSWTEGGPVVAFVKILS